MPRRESRTQTLSVCLFSAVFAVMPCHQSLSENSEPPKLSCLIIGGSIATAKLAAMLWKSHISIWGFPDIGVPHTYIIYIYICMCICFCICIYPKDLPYTYNMIKYFLLGHPIFRQTRVSPTHLIFGKDASWFLHYWIDFATACENSLDHWIGSGWCVCV